MIHTVITRLLVMLASLLTAAPVAAQGVFGALEEEAPTGGAGARRAFVIGVNTYDDPSFGPLRFAQRDAERLGSVLADPARGGFAAVEVVVDGDLTARGIVSRLQAWSETIGPQDLAVVYFSGHGTRKLDEKNRSIVYLATSDTAKEAPETSAIPLSAMQEFLTTLPTTRRLLVVDACFTGDGKIPAATAEAFGKVVVDEKMPFSDAVAEKEAQLYATTYGRPALELEGLQHGVYTAYFIDALDTAASVADVNQDAVISVSEAHDYARDATLAITGEVQIPMALYKIIGNEDLFLSGDVMARSDAQLALITSYAGPQQGMVMLLDGEEKGAFPRTLAIEPGAHVVEFRNHKGKLVDKGRMTFTQGRTYEVSQIRKILNGGRHMLSVGYAHSWFPGVQFKTEGVPDGPGVRIGYSLRFPGRSPAIRILGLGADLTYGGFPERDDVTASGSLVAPPTHMLDLGVGPTFRVPLGLVTVQVMPRVSGMLLLRSITGQPYLPWILGTVGADLSVAIHPHPQVGIKVHWIPSFTNATVDLTQADIAAELDLAPGWQPPIRFLNRIVGGIELGL